MKNDRAGGSYISKIIAVLLAAIVLLLTLIYFNTSKKVDITPSETSSIEQDSADSTNDNQPTIKNEDSAKTESPANNNGRLVSVNENRLTAARESAAKANQLPIENNFMVGRSLDSRHSAEFVDSLDFSNKMSLFESQMLKDPLAIELKNEYQNQIREETKQLGIDIELTKLVCGLKICAGAFRTTTPANLDIWNAHQMDPASSKIPMFAIAQSQVYVYGKESEQRFLFTISKENNSIVSNP